MSCPNITCYRCGRFGHHSRNCYNNKNNNSNVLCTSCGSRYHHTKSCDVPNTICNTPNTPNISTITTILDGDEHVRCMVCNAMGHAVCNTYLQGSAMPSISKATMDGVIYCSNCGMAGHHVDYPTTKISKKKKKNCNCCVPRAEAYQKFPMRKCVGIYMYVYVYVCCIFAYSYVTI